jgi:hypothetical protein
MIADLADDRTLPTGAPVNISRRRFLMASAGATAGAFVLGFGLPPGAARAQGAAVVPGTRVPAFLEIRRDGTIRLQSPFVEGGQGIFTAMAQIVGEELDADPARFVVENAPAGPDYKVMGTGAGRRVTGGSNSVRSSYATMRRIGATARAMLVQAGAAELGVPVGELTTEPGHVIHVASQRKLAYGDLAQAALDLPVPAPETVVLKDKAQFRWIGKPLARLDVHAKSTGQAAYAIDAQVPGICMPPCSTRRAMGWNRARSAMRPRSRRWRACIRCICCPARSRSWPNATGMRAAPPKQPRSIGANPQTRPRSAICPPIFRPRPLPRGWPRPRARAMSPNRWAMWRRR